MGLAGNTDDKAVQRVIKEYLAGQTTGPRGRSRKVEHILLRFAGDRQPVKMIPIHDHMAGGTSHLTFAGPFQRLARRLGDVQQDRSAGGVNLLSAFAIGADEGDRDQIATSLGFMAPLVRLPLYL